MSNDENTQVADSSPAMRTIFPQEIEGSGESDTDLAQNPAGSESATVKFPKRIRHRGRVLATIYGKSHKYPRYRLAFYLAGRRRQLTFSTYSAAKTEADKKVKDIAKGSQATALTSAQARDALAALERLRTYYQSTGRKVSLLSAVSEFTETSAMLYGHSLGKAVRGFLNTVANVTRKDIGTSARVLQHVYFSTWSGRIALSKPPDAIRWSHWEQNWPGCGAGTTRCVGSPGR